MSYFQGKVAPTKCLWIPLLLSNLMFSSISAMVAMNAFYVPESPPDSSQPDPSESGMRLSGREVLGHNGSYILEWSYDYKAQVITFNITAKTTGWVGFGLSRDGSMKEADIVIAVVQANGPPYIIDMFADYKRKLITDSRQDWTLISAIESSGYTNIQISRALDTCDPMDYHITTDLVYALWATGETDDLDYHFDKRGSIRLYLLDPLIKSEENLELFSITSTVTLPAQVTSYMCSVYRGPELTVKRHLVEFHPYLGDDLAVAHTHHFVIWQCAAPPGMNITDIFDPFVGQSPQECLFTDNLMQKLLSQLCRTFVVGWGVGGKILKLPPSTGIAIGQNPHEYFLVQTHYNNPEKLSSITITTGMNMYYTDKLRLEKGLVTLTSTDNDGGGFTAGYDLLGLYMVPPISTNFQVVGMCSADCTTTLIPESGVEIIAVGLHAHVSARKVKLEHFRDGKRLKVVMQDDNYDPYFQQVRPMYEPHEILPGDMLATKCEYDNTWTNTTVINGFGTLEEMCVSFITITKRLAGGRCFSQVPQSDLLPPIGVESVKWNIETRARDVTAPSELAGKSLSYVVDELTDWNKNLRFQIQNITLFATQIGTCPSILLPSSETPSDVPTESGKLPVEPMKLTSIGEGENLDGILALAMQMGIDEDALKELMSGGLPNRTPGPISSTTYPGEVPTPKPRFCPRRSSTPVNPPVRPPPQQAPYPHPYYSTIQSTAPSSGNNVHPYHVYSTSNIYG